MYVAAPSPNDLLPSAILAAGRTFPSLSAGNAGWDTRILYRRTWEPITRPAIMAEGTVSPPAIAHAAACVCSNELLELAVAEACLTLAVAMVLSCCWPEMQAGRFVELR